MKVIDITKLWTDSPEFPTAKNALLNLLNHYRGLRSRHVPSGTQTCKRKGSAREHAARSYTVIAIQCADVATRAFEDELYAPGFALARPTLSTRPAARATSLYLALQALKDLEHRVQFEAEPLGFQRAFPEIGPANVKGIELNPYAAELARVSVWIGEIQWMRRNGFAEARNPILKPLDTIECRDAILTPDNAEPDWPEADIVIGNPPFLGGKLLITHLGEDYVSQMFKTYAGRVPAEADLVCYWFEKAGQEIAAGRTRRVGLVATNSIRGGANIGHAVGSRRRSGRSPRPTATALRGVE